MVAVMEVCHSVSLQGESSYEEYSQPTASICHIFGIYLHVQLEVPSLLAGPIN